MNALLSLLLAAGPGAGDALSIRPGPMMGGVARVFDLRSSLPDTEILIHRGSAGGPTLPADPTRPILGVQPAGAPVVLRTDLAGRMRLVLPAPSAYARGTSFFQATARASDGRWVSSEVRAVRREPPLPADGSFLADSSATLLPGSRRGLAALRVRAVDLDRDGWPDLVLASPTGLRLWINDRSGRFVDETAARISDGGAALSALALGDVDGDGDVDLLAGGEGQVPDRLWLNDGSGRFHLVPGFPAGSGRTANFELGDLDGDGDLDLLVVKSDIGSWVKGPGEANRLLLNDGTGRFTDATATSTSWWRTAS